MSSDFNFTVTFWFPENVREKPYFKTQCRGEGEGVQRVLNCAYVIYEWSSSYHLYS